MDEAKAHLIALRPFKIVHQAPGEVAAQRKTIRDEIAADREMIGVVVEPRLVIHLAVGADAHVVGGAVLCDVHLGKIVAAVEVFDEQLQRRRIDFPADIRLLVALRRGVLRPREVTAPRGIIGHPHRRIIVEPPPVELAADRREIALFDLRHAIPQRIEKRRRILAFEGRAEEGAVVEIRGALGGGLVFGAVGTCDH